MHEITMIENYLLQLQEPVKTAPTALPFNPAMNIQNREIMIGLNLPPTYNELIIAARVLGACKLVRD
jgi:hypothetical protein